MSQRVITIIWDEAGNINAQATPGMTKTDILGLLEMAKILYVESWKQSQQSIMPVKGNGQTDRLLRG